MTDDDKRTLYLACNRFLRGHYPTRMKDDLLALSEHVGAEELPEAYGAGHLIEDFEAEIANLLGKPAAVFMPSGTMAQVITLRIWCDKVSNHNVAFHAKSHLEMHEQHSYRELHGLKAELLGHEDKLQTLSDFETSTGKFAAALLELPQRELGGILPTWADLTAMSNYCRSRGIKLHLDGARLWETTPYYQKSLAEICALFDSVYVSFYKGLGGIAGAVLCGSKEFVAEVKVWQRRHGGNLYTLYPYILAARAGMKKRLPKMPTYVAKAKEIAQALGSIEGITITPPLPQTNMMHLTFDRDADKLETAFAKIAAEKKIGLFMKLQRVKGQPQSKAELSVGDATLDLDTTLVASLFRQALEAE